MNHRYKIKVGRYFFRWLIFYKTIHCENETIAAQKLSNYLCTSIKPDNLYWYVHDEYNYERTFIMKGKTHIRLIEL